MTYPSIAPNDALVINFAAGASITAGRQIQIQGRVYTFVTASTGGLNEIVYATTNTAAQIAQLVEAELIDDGFKVTRAGTQVTIRTSTTERAVTQAGTHNVIGLHPEVIVARPGFRIKRLSLMHRRAIKSRSVPS